jgi:hypothetical protein
MVMQETKARSSAANIHVLAIPQWQGGNVITVSLDWSPDSTLLPGQTVYLTVPSISLHTAHPFSIASVTAAAALGTAAACVIDEGMAKVNAAVEGRGAASSPVPDSVTRPGRLGRQLELLCAKPGGG